MNKVFKKQKQVHYLINKERKKKGLNIVVWDWKLFDLAKSQAIYCARKGHLIHSNRYAYQGGENLAQVPRGSGAKTIVDCWMHSKAGHREYLLSYRVKSAGVGIYENGRWAYVAWAFSDHKRDMRYRKKKSSLRKFFNKLFKGILC